MRAATVRPPTTSKKLAPRTWLTEVLETIAATAALSASATAETDESLVMPAQLTVREAKAFLRARGITVRP